MSQTSPDAEARKQELARALLDGWRVLASEPAVLVFEDAHWADPESVELLGRLFELTDEAPLLILCAVRPERQAPAWRLKHTAETDYPHRYTELALGPLAAGESGALVDRLLAGAGAGADTSPEARRRILEGAEGNPLFLEELTRDLLDRGAPARDGAAAETGALAVPDSLQALLMARIDRLDEDARHTLQLAAVIGRAFGRRLLAAVAEPGTDLDRHLRALQRLDLIREVARFPEPEYRFRHALTREAVYNAILRRRRREWHRRAAEALETLCAGRLAECAPAIGRHFRAAGDERAACYLAPALTNKPER